VPPGGSASQGTQNPVLNEIVAAGVPVLSIGGMQIPLSGTTDSAVWALLNLIMCIAGAVLAVLMLIRAAMLRRRKDDRDDGGDWYHDDDEEEKRRKARPIWLALTVLFAVVGVLFFALTEDMTLLMVLVDQWTIVNAIILLIEIISVRMIFRTRREDEEQEQPAVQ
jgi:heme/copper-type cytochrome/quinol oxidase subunit 2